MIKGMVFNFLEGSSQRPNHALNHYGIVHKSFVRVKLNDGWHFFV